MLVLDLFSPEFSHPVTHCWPNLVLSSLEPIRPFNILLCWALDVPTLSRTCDPPLPSLANCGCHPLRLFLSRSGTYSPWTPSEDLHGFHPHLAQGICVFSPSGVYASLPLLPHNVCSLGSRGVCVTWCLSHSSLDILGGALTTGGSLVPPFCWSSK